MSKLTKLQHLSLATSFEGCTHYGLDAALATMTGAAILCMHEYESVAEQRLWPDGRQVPYVPLPVPNCGCHWCRLGSTRCFTQRLDDAACNACNSQIDRQPDSTFC